MHNDNCNNQCWLLPEYFSDALPNEAFKIEQIRRKLLDLYFSNHFELVIPPTIEYLESLMTGSGKDLDLKTFKIIDEFSGRLLGIRADITPQIARIDAHLLLNRQQQINKLCYCGNVLYTRPDNITQGRERQQIGVEIFGNESISADFEIIDLLKSSLAAINVPLRRIDLNHVGIFNALVELFSQLVSSLNEQQISNLSEFLQHKDIPALQSFFIKKMANSQHILDSNRQTALEVIGEIFCELPNLYGDDANVVLQNAKQLFSKLHQINKYKNLKNLEKSITDLEWLISQNEKFNNTLSLDLSDLRGYHYHTGVVFSAYGGTENQPLELARGGRYDGVGKAFGRNRAATGFSMDLRTLANILI